MILTMKKQNLYLSQSVTYCTWVQAAYCKLDTTWKLLLEEATFSRKYAFHKRRHEAKGIFNTYQAKCGCQVYPGFLLWTELSDAISWKAACAVTSPSSSGDFQLRLLPLYRKL